MSHTVRFGKYYFVVYVAIFALTSNSVYSKRLHSVSTEKTVADTSLGTIGILGLSLCYNCAYDMKHTLC